MDIDRSWEIETVLGDISIPSDVCGVIKKTPNLHLEMLGFKKGHPNSCVLHFPKGWVFERANNPNWVLAFDIDGRVRASLDVALRTLKLYTYFHIYENEVQISRSGTIITVSVGAYSKMKRVVSVTLPINETDPFYQAEILRTTKEIYAWVCSTLDRDFPEWQSPFSYW